jgi:ribose 5-phosphate isomerase A
MREGAPVTADGNVIVDFLGKVDDPNELASVLAAVPGVVEHGLFPANLVSEVLVGRADGSVERLTPG